MKIELTKFGERHFNKSFNGTKILDISKKEFTERINKMFNTLPLTSINSRHTLGKSDKNIKLRPGYASFCKLFFVENFTETKTGTAPITLENYQYLRSGYSSRRKEELPTLSRWFEMPQEFIPKAKYLNVILYTREHLYKEWLSNPSKQKSDFKLAEDVDFGIVAILAQMGDKEEPMPPGTMIRNGGYNTEEYQKSIFRMVENIETEGNSILESDIKEMLQLQGKMCGGSGSPINEEKYRKSVEFWSKNAIVK